MDKDLKSVIEELKLVSPYSGYHCRYCKHVMLEKEICGCPESSAYNEALADMEAQL